jgi:hypothetical protein
MNALRIVLIALTALLLPLDAWSQAFPEFVSSTGERPEAGWHAFTDVGFLLEALFTLTLAALLGALIAYHPRTLHAADTIEDVRAPKVYTMYSVIGAIIGMMVLEYGMVIGFVVFGIGGLIRFRTDLRSAALTGQVILVTLIGLSCGLNLPNVAVLATAFGFALIYVRDMRVTYRIEVQGVNAQQLPASAAAYRGILEQQGCRILSEKKNAAKQRLVYIFNGTRHVTRQRLEDLFERAIDPALKGSVEWEID